MNTEEKFLEIYEKYKNLVLKVVFDMTRDYHLSQDICQETFMRLYGYEDDIIMDRVKNWLVVVASNLVYDHWKKSSSRKEILSEDIQGDGARMMEPAVCAELERAESRRLCSNVLKALREKNETWYEVLILAEYLGVPRKVIARERGVALSTIDSYLRISKMWMKSNFHDEYEEL